MRRNLFPALLLLSVFALVAPIFVEPLLGLWGYFLPWYFLMLVLTGLTIGLKSVKTEADASFFGYRFLWPLVLMAPVGFPLVGMVFYMLVWLLTFAFIFLSISDIANRIYIAIRYSDLPDVWGNLRSGGNLKQTIWGVLDKIYTQRWPMTLKLPPGVPILMEVYQSEWVAIYEKMFGRGFRALGVGAVIGAGLVLCLGLIEGFLLGLEGIAAGKFYVPWPLFFVGLGLTLVPVLVYTYYVESWNQLHHKYIFTPLLSIFAEIEVPDPVPNVHMGKTEKIEGIDLVRAGETKNTNISDSLAYWLRGTQEVVFKTTIFRDAAQITANRAYAVSMGLQAVLARAREYGKMKDEAISVDIRAKLSEKLAEMGLDPIHASTHQPGDVVAAFNALVEELYGAAAIEINLWDVHEPLDGSRPLFWNRMTNQPVDAASVAPSGEPDAQVLLKGFARRAPGTTV